MTGIVLPPHTGPEATPELFARLAEPFDPLTLDWRIGQSGFTKDDKPWAKVLAYMDARAARERLNEVMGHTNWTVKYFPAPGDGVLAELALRFGHEWIAKQDGANLTNIEATKGGVSDSFKRACAAWGIGEYLYEVSDTWATFIETEGMKGRYYSEIKKSKDDKNGKRFWWNPPVLPEKFLPLSMRGKSNGNRYPERDAARTVTPARHENRTAPTAEQSESTQPRSTRTSTPPKAAAAPAPAAPPPAAAKPATKADRARDFVMKFGHTHIKGKRLGDISFNELEKAYDWAKKNGKDYADFYEAFECLANELISQGGPSPHDHSDNYADRDELPAALRDQDDDLPF